VNQDLDSIKTTACTPTICAIRPDSGLDAARTQVRELKAEVLVLQSSQHNNQKSQLD
jgi:hypothetical protein